MRAVRSVREVNSPRRSSLLVRVEKNSSINRPWGILPIMSGFGGSGEALEVCLEAGDDTGVPGDLGVPAACGGVVAERGDVGELGLQLRDELRRGDVVV